MKLIIFLGSKWINKDQFPSDCDYRNTMSIPFRKYTDMANFLDRHKEFKNNVMVVRNPNQVLGNKVIFNDFVFVEGRGFI